MLYFPQNLPLNKAVPSISKLVLCGKFHVNLMPSRVTLEKGSSFEKKNAPTRLTVGKSVVRFLG